MKRAYNIDIWRTVQRGRKRFFSILLITALGVTMLSGLKAACVDLRYSADEFFDGQRLFDISIVSTLGLTEEDVDALKDLEEVRFAEGAYSETVHIKTKGKEQSAELKSFQKDGLNLPYLLEGVLPENDHEIAVTEKYRKDSGKSTGDSLTLDEYEGMQYTITAVVTDPTDINSADGAVSFRSSSTTDYTFFVIPEVMEGDVYTAVYLTLQDSEGLLCYSDEYESLVKKSVKKIESQIKTQREKARYDEVREEAFEKLDDAEKEMTDQFAKAGDKLSDAQAELTDGLRKLDEGQMELYEKAQQAREELSGAWQQIGEGRQAFLDGEEQIKESEQQLSDGEKQLQGAEEELNQKQTEAEAQFEDARAALEKSKNETESNLARTEQQASQLTEQAAEVLQSVWPQGAWESFRTAAAAGSAGEAKETFTDALSAAVDSRRQEIEEQISALDSGAPDYAEQLGQLQAQKQQLEGISETLLSGLPELGILLGQLDSASIQIREQEDRLSQSQSQADAQFQAARQTLEEKRAELTQGKEELAKGEAELEGSRAQLDSGEAELTAQQENAESQIVQGQEELEANRRKLVDGQKELDENLKEFEKKRSKAEEKLSDSRKETDEIDMAQWYVRDRSSLSGYANIKSDASSIEAVGTAFPIVFFIVAILISLTTITRMVEEDRGLIGTYKALGFTNGEIRRKYELYALAACLTGGILGDVCGFIALPEIVFTIFRTMYVLPEYRLGFDAFYGIGGVFLFLAGIVGATVIACSAELKETPAVLMRPKAPGLGSRVFLERISPVWKRLSFLNKVTARNIFRYKKRLFMTAAGIMGCTALVLCGLAIKDSVTDLMPNQYEHIYDYDLMAVSSPEDFGKLKSYLDEDQEVESILDVRIDSVKLINAQGKEEKVQMFVIPDGEELKGYIGLEDLDGRKIDLAGNGIIITRNASDVLGVGQGETISVQDSELTEGDFKVTNLAENYLGNNLYMTQSVYEEVFGEYESNGVLANLSGACTDQAGFADALGRKEGVLSAVSTQAMKSEFSTAFGMINMVVYIIIVMAAGLALVVLFTLSTTNISERERELATIKVLGFFDREVHLYVNKETLILTGLGILLGLPLGHVLGNCLTYALQMPSINFAVSIHPVSYLIAAVISFGFALLVDLITNRVLDGIDPVEALKSNE